jgi:hypothetical protein
MAVVTPLDAIQSGAESRGGQISGAWLALGAECLRFHESNETN